MLNKVMMGLLLAAGTLHAQPTAAQQTIKDTTSVAKGNVLTEDQKIDRLIAYVQSMKNCKFVRNGSEHIPAEAAEHLQMKRKKHGTKLKTAEDFIEHLATKSSMTGEYYVIRMEDGQEVRLKDVLTKELERMSDN